MGDNDDGDLCEHVYVCVCVSFQTQFLFLFYYFHFSLYCEYSKLFVFSYPSSFYTLLGKIIKFPQSINDISSHSERFLFQHQKHLQPMLLLVKRLNFSVPFSFLLLQKFYAKDFAARQASISAETCSLFYQMDFNS